VVSGFHLIANNYDELSDTYLGSRRSGSFWGQLSTMAVPI
jgi:hypothetical protein